MNRLSAGIAICVALACVVSAQPKSDKARGAIAPEQASANATPQILELKEAEELAARVVKLFAEGNYEEALILAKRVLEIRDKALGPEHHLIDESLYNLAEIDVAMYMYKEAEPLYQRMLVHYEKVYGTEHLKTAKILERLAYISFRMEKFDEAEKRILRALAIYEKPPGVSVEQLASLTLQVAELYRAKGDKKKAEATYLRALELSDQVKDTSDSKTDSPSQKVYDRYMCFLYEIKSPGDAEKIERRLFEERNKAAQAGKQSIGEVLNGKARSLPTPDYPYGARTKGVEGTVRVRVTIDEQGKVMQADAICGPPSLRVAAVMAAYDALFTPTLLNGKPVTVTGTINYNFKLTRR